MSNATHEASAVTIVSCSQSIDLHEVHCHVTLSNGFTVMTTSIAVYYKPAPDQPVIRQPRAGKDLVAEWACKVLRENGLEMPPSTITPHVPEWAEWPARPRTPGIFG